MCYLYKWLAPQTVSVEQELIFQAPAPQPCLKPTALEMNNVVSTIAFAVVLFVRSLC